MSSIRYKYIRVRPTDQNSYFDPNRLYFYKCSRYSMSFAECSNEFLNSENPILVTKLPNGKFIQCDTDECKISINSVQQLNTFYFNVNVENIANSLNKKITLELVNIVQSSSLLFGYSLTSDIDSVSNWQTSNVFSPVSQGKKYFFVKNIDNNNNYIVYKEIKDATSGGGGEIIDLIPKTNLAKQLQTQTGINVLDLTIFKPIPIPTYNDNGTTRVNWNVGWDGFGKIFTDNSVKYYNVGITGSKNILSNFYLGSGIRGIDYVLSYNPDTGLSWEFDPVANASWRDFISAIPIHFRSVGDANFSYGQEPFFSGSLESCYDSGGGNSLSQNLGWGDNINGKTRRGLVTADIETNDENGSDKHRAYIIGMAEKTTGLVSSLYGGVFLTGGYIVDPETGNKKYYNYPQNDGTYLNTANISQDWKLTTYTSIPSRGVNNKRLMDYDNIIPCNEQSSHFEWFAQQGSHYPLDNSGNYIPVNKFGLHPTVVHPLGCLGTNLEIQSWYCYHVLNKRRNMFLAKTVADRGSLIGRNEFSIDQNGNYRADSIQSHSNQEIGRKYAFLFGLLTYMNKIDWFIWDKSMNDNEGSGDTYAGVFAVLKMLTDSGGIAAYNDMAPLLWETEYSLDGITWLKTKAIDWNTSTSEVLPVRSKISNSKWEIAAFRPEGVEPLEFFARVTIGGIVRSIHVTQDMWETTNHTYANTALADIPDANKEYYYQLFSF